MNLDTDNPCPVCFGSCYLLRTRLVLTGEYTGTRRVVRVVCPSCNGYGDSRERIDMAAVKAVAEFRK